MLGNKSVICVIPARLASTRLPQKMLALLKGKPLVQWAYEAAKCNPCFDSVVVAVDSEEVYGAVAQFGGVAAFTSKKCQSGTDRLVELQREGKYQGDIWVNWQGDEPFISSEMIEVLLQDPELEVATLKKKIDSFHEVSSPNVVKVVCNQKGEALYFSRCPIPYGGEGGHLLFKHVGIYAFSSQALEKIGSMPPAPLEKVEKLEQLRFLDGGMRVQVHETHQEIFGIDTKEELLAAEDLFFESGSAMLSPS